MKNIVIPLIAFLICTLVYSQETSKEIIKPILLDKSVLSGVGLEKIDLNDEPEKDFYQKRLYWGDEIGVFVVSTQNWNKKMKNFPFDEFIYMYHGEAVIRPEIATSQVFYAGDYFFAPKGFTGEWEIKGGNHLHYELSVIATQRADSSQVLKNARHKLFSKSKLSGNEIRLDGNGLYEEILKQGIELTVKLNGEKPSERVLDITEKEKLLQILSGQITIIDSEGNNHKYYTGDFVLIRKGLIGSWKSEGHGLVKYLSVEKTDSGSP